MTKYKRVYWKDIAELCAANGSAILQHPQSRSMTYVAKSGHSVWLINPETERVIKKLSELTLSEWKALIDETQLNIEGQINKNL
ncbi:hypothetical protein [Tatumella sp. OPLPL6]|uniref:hypothetical protein n=1 Tax=Tatumella sp. OPLPL6 TaxID=1928657 RepID=UPI000C1834C1|nr:hypothetical protein [Tatumella sp. OPLPL6]PIJ43352.1 hypothetical protein BOM24_09310 [Tatumella sp. OPLPL6]